MSKCARNSAEVINWKFCFKWSAWGISPSKSLRRLRGAKNVQCKLCARKYHSRSTIIPFFYLRLRSSMKYRRSNEKLGLTFVKASHFFIRCIITQFFWKKERELNIWHYVMCVTGDFWSTCKIASLRHLNTRFTIFMSFSREKQILHDHICLSLSLFQVWNDVWVNFFSIYLALYPLKFHKIT